MSKFVLIRGRDQKSIVGASAEDHELFEKFKRKVINGEAIRVETKRIRHAAHHRFYFKMMRAVFQHNNLFRDEEAMRKWIEMECGHFYTGVDSDGVVIKIPKSIEYEALDEDQFTELHKRAVSFITSEHGAALLFHQSTNPVASAEAVLGDYDWRM